MLLFSGTFLISQLDSLPLITLSNVRQLRLLPALRLVHRSRSNKCLALLPALSICAQVKIKQVFGMAYMTARTRSTSAGQIVSSPPNAGRLFDLQPVGSLSCHDEARGRSNVIVS